MPDLSNDARTIMHMRMEEILAATDRGTPDQKCEFARKARRAALELDGPSRDASPRPYLARMLIEVASRAEASARADRAAQHA